MADPTDLTLIQLQAIRRELAAALENAARDRELAGRAILRADASEARMDALAADLRTVRTEYRDDRYEARKSGSHPNRRRGYQGSVDPDRNGARTDCESARQRPLNQGTFTGAAQGQPRGRALALDQGARGAASGPCRRGGRRLSPSRKGPPPLPVGMLAVPQERGNFVHRSETRHACSSGHFSTT